MLHYIVPVTLQTLHIKLIMHTKTKNVCSKIKTKKINSWARAGEVMRDNFKYYLSFL